MRDASEISRALAGRAAALCRELLPGGVREGSEWRCGSLAGERGKSLAVHLHGPKAGIWADFASGQGGDALSLVAEARFGGDVGEALEWSRAWLGMSPNQAPPPVPGERERQAYADDADRRAAALKIFLKAEQKLIDTPADHYLRLRGIDLAQLGRQPRALRYHPALWNSEARREFPGLVAAVTNDAGEITAAHRTWLAKDAAGRWRKAPLNTPKASLGRVAGGTIRLWRGASGKPLAAAPPGEVVVIAEGIETGLSVAIACPELRVLAAVSLGNMSRIDLPAAIGTVIIAADNDEPGSQAEAALNAAAARFAAQGRKVRIARSPVGSDFNDCLTA